MSRIMEENINEKVDMCSAIQAMVDDAREETLAADLLRRIKAMYENGFSFAQMCKVYSDYTEEEIRTALKQQGFEAKE